jgi:hypothetical protein
MFVCRALTIFDNLMVICVSSYTHLVPKRETIFGSEMKSAPLLTFVHLLQISLLSSSGTKLIIIIEYKLKHI